MSPDRDEMEDRNHRRRSGEEPPWGGRAVHRSEMEDDRRYGPQARGDEGMRRGPDFRRRSDEVMRRGDEPMRRGDEVMRRGDEPMRRGDEPMRRGDDVMRRGNESRGRGDAFEHQDDDYQRVVTIRKKATEEDSRRLTPGDKGDRPRKGNQEDESSSGEVRVTLGCDKISCPLTPDR